MATEQALSEFDYDACKAWYCRQASQQDSTLKQSCCSPMPPRYVADVLRAMNPNWSKDFMGHGYPLPPALAGCKIAVVGCDTGRDVFLAAALVGAGGTVVGIDWREDRLARAQQAMAETICMPEQQVKAETICTPEQQVKAETICMPEQQGDETPLLKIEAKVEYRKGYPEMLSDLGFEDASFDLIIVNCVLSGTYDIIRTLVQIDTLLKPRGELMFTDIICPMELTNNPVEAYTFFEKGQLKRIMKTTGWCNFLIVSREEVHLGAMCGTPNSLPFELVCCRALKQYAKGASLASEGVLQNDGLMPKGLQENNADNRQENFFVKKYDGGFKETPKGKSFAVTYTIPIPENKRYFDFDEEHRFILGRPKSVNELTTLQLMESRYGQYFSCIEEGLVSDEELGIQIEMLVADCLGIVDASSFTPDTRLKEDAGATSLDLLQLAVELEDEFAISLDESIFESIKTIGDVISCVMSAFAEQQCHD